MNSKKLYHFLMTNECHLFKRPTGIVGWVAVYFHEMNEFVEIIGSEQFGDGGIEVTMMEHYIAVEIDGILDGTGEKLSDYKECFDGKEWDDFFVNATDSSILQGMEGEKK